MTDAWGPAPQQYGPPQGQPQYGAPQQAAPAQGGWGAPPGQPAPQAAPPPSLAEVWGSSSAGAGVPNVPFAEPGEAVIGQILSLEQVPKTEPPRVEGGEPIQKFYSKGQHAGQPIYQIKAVLQTAHRHWENVAPKKIPTDKPDDGKRAVYLYYRSREAVAEATGGPPPEVGMELGMQYTGREVPGNERSPKLFRAIYRQPTQDYSAPPIDPSTVRAAQSSAPQGPPPAQYAPQGYAPQGPPQGAPQGYAPQGPPQAPPAAAPQQYGPPQGAPQGPPQAPPAAAPQGFPAGPPAQYQYPDQPPF